MSERNGGQPLTFKFLDEVEAHLETQNMPEAVVDDLIDALENVPIEAWPALVRQLEAIRGRRSDAT